MDEQFSSLILCQKNVQELFTLNQRLEKKLELQDNKISHLTLQLTQRNEDILLNIEKYTPLKLFREENSYLRNFLEQKTKAFQQQFDQVQNSMMRSIQQIKEDNQVVQQNSIEKVNRTTTQILFQLESVEKKIFADTKIMVDELTKKSAEMEQNFMKLFSQEHKLIEKIALSQETSIAKINVFENTLNQSLSTISKIQETAQKQQQQQFAQNHSVRKLNFDTAEAPLDMLKRQEDVLNYMTVSIKNIEKKLAETEQKPRLKRDLSFDQFSVQWSQQKPQSQQQQQATTTIKPILIKESQVNELLEKSARSDIQEKTNRTELASNVAEPLLHEQKSPAYQHKPISTDPLFNKASPNSIVSCAVPNFYEDVRIKKDYEEKMRQIKQQEEQMRQQKLKQQQDYEKQLQQLKKSQSDLSNNSSMMRNDSYFMNKDVSLNRNDSQELIKSTGGLRSLMNKSKEREQQQKQMQQSQSKQNLNQVSPQKKQAPKVEPLNPLKSDPLKSVAQGGRKSRTNQMRNLAKQQQDQSVEEVVYQLDEDGYLMDENGNYLLDERGNYIQINDHDLEELKRQNLVVEQE